MSTPHGKPEYDPLSQSSASILSTSSSTPHHDIATLTKDVDHIKELIALSDSGPSESISRSIFRQSKRISVTQPQILKELDRLKRHLRKADDATQTANRDLGDPEDDDEEESQTVDQSAHATEVAHLKAEIARITRERESWIENLERRLDDSNDKATDALKHAEELQHQSHVQKTQHEAALGELDAVRNQLTETKSTINSLQSRLDDSQSKATSQDTELRRLREAHDKASGDLGAATISLESAQQASEALRAESIAKQEAHARELQNLQADFSTKQKAHSEELQKHADETASAYKRLHESDAALQTKGARLEDLENQLQESRRLLEASESRIRNSGAELETVKSKGSKLESLVEELQSTVADSDRKLSDARQSEEAAKSLQQASDNELVASRQQVDQLKEAVEDARQSAISEAEGRISEINTAHALEDRNLREEMAQKEADSAAKMRNMEAAHSKLVEQIRSENANNSSETKATHDRALADLVEAHKHELSTMQGKHDEDQSTRNQAFEVDRSRLSEALRKAEQKTAELSAACEHATAELDEAKARASEETASLEFRHASEMRELMSSHQQRENDMSSESAEKFSALELQSKNAAEAHQTQVESLRSEHQEALTGLQRQLAERDAEHARMKESHLSELEQMMKKTSQQKDEAIAEIQTAHEKKLKELEDYHRGETIKARSDVTHQLAEANQKHAEELEQQRREHEEKAAMAQKQLEDRLAAEEGVRTRVVDELEAKSRADIEEVKKEHTNAMHDLETKLSAEKAATSERLSQSLADFDNLSRESERLAKEIEALHIQRKREAGERQAKEAELQDQLLKSRAESEAAQRQIQELSQAKSALEESIFQAAAKRDAAAADLRSQIEKLSANQSQLGEDKAGPKPEDVTAANAGAKGPEGFDGLDKDGDGPEFGRDSFHEGSVLSSEFEAAISRVEEDIHDLTGDLAISPGTFEKTMSRLSLESARLESEREASEGQQSPITPRRSSMSTSGVSPYARSHHNSSIPRATHGRHSSIGTPAKSPTLSHARNASGTFDSASPDGPIARRTVTNPRSSPAWARPGGSKDMDLGIAPEDYESSRGSLDGSRPGAEAHNPHLRHASGNVTRMS